MTEARVRSGRQARQVERAKKGGVMGRPYILRNIPTYDILSEENLLKIEAAADRILAETGIEFRDDAVALEHWRRAGAKVDGLLVKFEPGMLREILKSAPREFTQHARNPANSVRIGGRNVVFAPAYGSPFVMDLDRGRRYGTGRRPRTEAQQRTHHPAPSGSSLTAHGYAADPRSSRAQLLRPERDRVW